MTSEQKFVWWLKGVLDSSNDNPDFELIKEELEKVTRETVTTPFSFISTSGKTIEIPSWPPSPTVGFPDWTHKPSVTYSTADLQK